jgi:hypothetical protein
VKKLAILDVAIPGDGADFSQNGRRWHHALFRTLDLPERLFEGRELLIINWLFENYGYLPNWRARALWLLPRAAAGRRR